MKNYRLFKAITRIKIIYLTFLTCSFLLHKTEVARTESLVECGQTYVLVSHAGCETPDDL